MANPGFEVSREGALGPTGPHFAVKSRLGLWKPRIEDTFHSHLSPPFPRESTEKQETGVWSKDGRSETLSHSCLVLNAWQEQWSMLHGADSGINQAHVSHGSGEALCVGQGFLTVTSVDTHTHGNVDITVETRMRVLHSSQSFVTVQATFLWGISCYSISI